LKKIYFVHLLNNYSGAPKVLYLILSGLSKKREFEIHLLTSKTNGFLTDIPFINYNYISYKWKTNRILLLFRLLNSEIELFFRIFFSKKVSIVYINTILPFGAAIAAYLRHIPVIYHVHEYYINPNIFQKLCMFILKKTATEIICVSNFVKEKLKTGKEIVIYNALMPINKTDINIINISRKYKNRLLVMASSLKIYKGIYQFIELARTMPEYKFILICSAGKTEIKNFFSNKTLPLNFHIITQQKNIDNIYRNASIVMNLTLPDQCVETFGMTLIEGFNYACPAIAPNIGGPSEIVINNLNGKLVNPADTKSVKECINSIMNSESSYKIYSENANLSAKKYLYENFITNIYCIINKILLEK
jgi:L-malate glycosyltransferase